jgi:SAM-dependent methyltransferase
MSLSQSLSRKLAVTCVAAAFALNGAFAQPAPDTKTFEPQVGQEGKDVVWVPTPQALVDRMLDMAKVTAADTVIDLGSGDGRTVITAAKRGAKAMGIEFNPDMVELSKRNAAKEGVGDKAVFVQGDIFKSDFSKADVITLFLLTSLNAKLRPILLDMKPGTRVVSNTFDMGDWTPDDQVQATGECRSYCRAFFWVVPAKVGGTWQTPDGELTLEQKYQMVSGKLKSGSGTTDVNGKLVGDQITFGAGDTTYTGRVSGNSMELTSKGATDAKITATKKAN